MEPRYWSPYCSERMRYMWQKLILGIKVLSRNEKESVYQKELEIKYYFSSVSPEKGKVEKVQIINLLVLQFCCVH